MTQGRRDAWAGAGIALTVVFALATVACSPSATCASPGAIRCQAADNPQFAPKASVCKDDKTWGDYVACPSNSFICTECATTPCPPQAGCQLNPCTGCSGSLANYANICPQSGEKLKVYCGPTMGTCTPSGGCGGPCGLGFAPVCMDSKTVLNCTSGGVVMTQACDVACVDGVGCTTEVPDATGSDVDAAGSDAQTDDTDASSNGGDTSADVAPNLCATDVEGNSCSDGINCTVDTCNPATGACSHVPSDALCDDGAVCTADHCTAGGGTFTCTHAAVAGPCDDGNSCTLNDACAGTACTGTQKNCNDGNVCTNDACSGDCEHTPLPELCDNDGSVCTPDACEAGVCKSGAPIGCDDKNPCTIDVCDPVQSCTHTPAPISAVCDDGIPCTQSDHCQAGACTGTPLTCEAGQECVAGSCQTPNHDWTSWKPPAVPSGLTPDPSGDTAYHALTGRTWQRAASATKINWAAAQALCDGLVLAGKSDWRLPTVVELISLLDLSKAAPSALIDLVAFPDTPPGAFWTGTQWSTSGMYVGVNFQMGAGGPVDAVSKNYVRCVR